MIKIQIVDGRPAQDIPADASLVVIDGEFYNVYLPGDELPTAPQQAEVIAPVSPRQLRQALTRTGLRSAVEAAVAAADQDTRDWWEFATEFDRQHPALVGMAAQLGYTPEQVDQVFALAASL